VVKHNEAIKKHKAAVAAAKQEQLAAMATISPGQPTSSRETAKLPGRDQKKFNSQVRVGRSNFYES
jgi:predicted transcriptional regulator